MSLIPDVSDRVQNKKYLQRNPAFPSMENRLIRGKSLVSLPSHNFCPVRFF